MSFQINLGCRRLGFRWMSCMEPFYVIFWLFFNVSIQVQASNDFQSASTWKDNDWIFYFWVNLSFNFRWLVWIHATDGEVAGGDLPSPSGGTWVSIVGVGLEPSSGLRVRKKRKETTIIEVNTIYSPELLNGWDLHMARPRQTEKQTERQIE